MNHIPFNRPYMTGLEIQYMKKSLESYATAGNGSFTKKCQSFFEEKLRAKKVLVTTSCTDALEMCAMLCQLQEGDEVIIPSYTFVSTALAFVRCGAKIVFADSSELTPCVDSEKIESLISLRTKVIVVVHYAGIACDMDRIMSIAFKHNILVVEDAAQAVDSYYKGVPLGAIGHFSAFSFHETKNVQCGEGGLLVINDERFCKRAEIIWEKGTNRAEFFRGEIDKYGWKDLGSSFLPADYVAAFLLAQIEQIEKIQAQRKAIWNKYYNALKDVVQIKVPFIPDYATNNGHMFYILCPSCDVRTKLIIFLKQQGIQTAFHYLSLHKSPYIQEHQKDCFLKEMPLADYYTENLLRLPLYFEMTPEEVDTVISKIKVFFNNQKL